MPCQPDPHAWIAPKRAPGVTEKFKIRQAVLIGELHKLNDRAASPLSRESTAYSSWSPPSTIAPSSRTERRWRSGEQQLPHCSGQGDAARQSRQAEKRRPRPANPLKLVFSLGLRRKSPDVKAPNLENNVAKGRRIS
jgi:hypothetical protein